VFHGGITLWATLLGFLTGTLLAMAMAVGIVHSRVMDLSVMPWAIISQTIPIVALAPMIVVVSNKVGIDSTTVPKVIISAYLSYFPVLVSMLTGLRSPDQMQLDLLKTYGASEAQIFGKLRLPASLPYFFASMKIAMAASLVGAIVGELPTGAVQGLGARMLIGSQFGQPLIMWSALFAAAILAAGLIVIVGLIERGLARRMGVRQ
jgi:NitT/TauT family transport system permease protein